jgi:hypothetical protein
MLYACLADKPYRHLVERAELENSAAAALIQARMRQASVVAMLQRAATSVDISSDVALVCGYLLTILGVPLAATCLCLRRPFHDNWPREHQATQPPWVRLDLPQPLIANAYELPLRNIAHSTVAQVPLHRMRASDAQAFAPNPFARPNPIDPWRLPGPGELLPVLLLKMPVRFHADGQLCC